jgi:pre-mRNA-splicing factor ISY1
MARPAEKARAMLNKWVALREQEGVGGNRRPGGAAAGQHKPGNRRRPYLASECEFLADAERFRNQIVREISEGIAKIQNPALGEHEIRDLNDDINHKMREKWHWNRRIIELGGVDYNQLERQRQLEQEGTATSAIGVSSSSSGASAGGRYQYFGAAKDLPGVKEMLAKEEETRMKQLHQKKSLKELYSNITPDYYGWRDEEDGVLLELEALATKQNDQAHNNKTSKRLKATKQEDAGKDADGNDDDYLNVPNQEQVSRMLLEIRKKAFLEKYNL